MRRMVLLAAVTGAITTIGLGCGGHAKSTRPAQALRPAAFLAPSPATQPTTQPVNANPVAETPVVAPAPQEPVVASPAPAVPASPEARPAVRPPASTLGGYMIVGTVIAEANAQPIYADKVLTKIDPVLATKAQELDARQFRIVAANTIRDAVMLEIRNELLFASAQRNCDEEEQQIAAALTTQWRQKEITKAGGSAAVARHRASEDGDNFDEKVKEQYRRWLVYVHLQKHVWPRIKISADDLREFYDRNLEAFSEKSDVRFRLVKVAYGNSAASKERALEKARALLARARGGEDFARIAGEGDDRTLAKNKGYLFLERDAQGKIIGGARIQRGTLKQEDLEKAIFALEKGQTTDILDGRDGFYYFAHLEDKTLGKVKAFEEPEVQEAIRKVLDSRQKDELQRKEEDKLMKASIWAINERNIETAVDMAMQKYVIWRTRL